MTIPLSQEYERQAKELEESPVPWILKITRFVAWVVYAVVLVEVALLITAFFLRLFGANPDAGFTQWVYRSVARAMEPFSGIFPSQELSGESVLEFSLLFAAIVYLVLAFVVDAVLRWLGRQLHDRERQVAELRASSRDAALKEYEAEQQRAAQEQVAEHTAAAVQAATTQQQPVTGVPPADQQQPVTEAPPVSPPPGQPPTAGPDGTT